MFSALKIKDFRLYWTGMFISLIGTWIQIVTQSWLVFQLTHSSFLLGLVGFLSSIPVFLFSLLGGVVADRCNKRNILLLTQNVFMLLAFVLAILTHLKIITPAYIMIIAVLNGIVMAFDAPTRQAVIVELVGKEHLMNVIALNSAAFNSARILGPAIAGILIAAVGMSGCFYINGFSFLAVIIALLLIKKTSQPRSSGRLLLLKDIKEGVIYSYRNRMIFVLLSIIGMISLLGISYVILMPVFAADVLGVGVKGLAGLMSSVGIGAVCAALLLARLGDFKGKGKVLLASCFIFSLSLILFSLSRIYVLSLLVLVAVGGTSVSAMSIVNTVLQQTVSDAFRGRVMSLFMFTFAGIMPFGNLIAGTLASHRGASYAVMVSGVSCAVFFFVIIFSYPRLKTL
jgi:MFS family permease